MRCNQLTLFSYLKCSQEWPERPHQRYKCKDCGRRFDGGILRDKSQVITDYVEGKQTLEQLAIKYGVNERTIRRDLEGMRYVYKMVTWTFGVTSVLLLKYSIILHYASETLMYPNRRGYNEIRRPLTRGKARSTLLHFTYRSLSRFPTRDFVQ